MNNELLKQINVNTNSKVAFQLLDLAELLDEVKVKPKIDLSEILVTTDTDLEVDSVEVNDLMNLVAEFKDLQNLNSLAFSTFTLLEFSLSKFGFLLNELIHIKDIKNIEVVSITTNILKLKLYTGYLINPTVDVKLPNRINSDLKLKLDVVGGAKMLMKIANFFMSSNKGSVVVIDGTVLIIDLKLLLDKEGLFVFLLENWIQLLKIDFLGDNGMLTAKIEAKGGDFVCYETIEKAKANISKGVVDVSAEDVVYDVKNEVIDDEIVSENTDEVIDEGNDDVNKEDKLDV